MAIPPNIKARLEQLKMEAALRSEAERRRALAQQNAEKMTMPIQRASGGSAQLMGINVATDRKSGHRYADMIVDGHKTLESRNSDTLRPYVGKRVAIVRTGEGPAKAIGEVTIGEPMVVNKQKFRALEDKHHVPEGSAFDINTPTKHLYPMHDPVRYEQERDVGHGIIARKVIHEAKGGSIEVRPTVKDDAIQRKVPEMEEAAKAVSAGRMSHEDYDKVVNKHKPVKPYTFVPQPASDEDADRALMENKKPHWRGHEDWPAGRKVGLRLDIPAYENHGVWVNSIHDEEGKGDDKRNTAYGPVSSVKNATFDAGPTKAIKVATGEQNKSPFARIKGELHHMSEDEAVDHMKKYLNHPDYAQVGMDPRRHGFFYDRKTMQPVTHSKHVVQIGPLVLAHKPTYGPRESYATGGKVAPSLDEMKLALNNQGMYSPLEKAAMAVPRTKGTPAEFMTEVSKQPGFRKNEVEDRKISLPEQKMTKQEFLAHLKKHPAPSIKEAQLGGDALDDRAEELAQDIYETSYNKLDYNKRRMIESQLEDEYGYNPVTKYETYVMPGGENYREILLKTPSFSPYKHNQIMELEANIRRMNPSDYPEGYVEKMVEGLQKLKAEKEAIGPEFQSGHWQGHPNVLAHIRLSDRFVPDENGKHNVIVTGGGGRSMVSMPSRQDAEAFAEVKRQGGYNTKIEPASKKKILHVEEIQSDWHQQGRKEGYKTAEENAKRARFEELGKKIRRGVGTIAEMDESAKLQNELNQLHSRVPDAPFKKNWHELAMKHVLGMAAKGGYQGVAITPGQDQADRYDLSKHVENIYHSANADGTHHASVIGPRGQVLWEDFRASPEKIEQHLGKDVAQKIVSGHGVEDNGMRRLDPADMKMGGEGMKGFYDKILPDYLNKVGKPHGAQVQMNAHRVKGSENDYGQAVENMGIAGIPMNELTPEQNQQIADAADKKLHYFPITDSLRQQIKTEGLPQYQTGGIINKAEGGNVQPSIAQMRMALTKQNPINMQKIGVNEAPDMSPKLFVSPRRAQVQAFPHPAALT